jgi:hypothetical protein
MENYILYNSMNIRVGMKPPNLYVNKNKIFEFIDFLDFFCCTYIVKSLKSLWVRMSYTITTAYGTVKIRCLLVLVLTVLTDLVGYRDIKWAVTMASTSSYSIPMKLICKSIIKYKVFLCALHGVHWHLTHHVQAQTWHCCTQSHLTEWRESWIQD